MCFVQIFLYPRLVYLIGTAVFGKGVHIASHLFKLFQVLRMVVNEDVTGYRYGYRKATRPPEKQKITCNRSGRWIAFHSGYLFPPCPAYLPHPKGYANKEYHRQSSFRQPPVKYLSVWWYRSVRVKSIFPRYPPFPLFR